MTSPHQRSFLDLGVNWRLSDLRGENVSPDGEERNGLN
jgi:hypothetical protein